MSDIKNVAILGVDGTLGTFVLDALLSSNFNITILKRASSKSKDNYPSHIPIKKIPDEFHTKDIAAALQGQDAIVVTIKGSQSDLQKRIADACVQAGVKRLIPADFGSCDSSTERAQLLIPLFARKTELREYLVELSKKHLEFTWTSLVTGHFFDWLEFLKVDVNQRHVKMLDEGDVKSSYSTRARIGEAVVRVLQRPEQTANQVLFVQSFCVTQRQIVDAFEKATAGGKSWNVERIDSKEYEREEVVKRDHGNTAEAIENLVWLLGAIDSNWEGKEGFAMKKLGLEDEDLEDVVRRIVENASQ